MKDIHPKYYPKAKATCACGAKFTIGSTQEEIKVERCSQCHPVYTGSESKDVERGGRIARFKARQEAAKKKA